jgi:hypothetical protein
VQGNKRNFFLKISEFLSVTEFIIKVLASNTAVCSGKRREKKLTRLLHMLKEDLNRVFEKYGAIS